MNVKAFAKKNCPYQAKLINNSDNLCMIKRNRSFFKETVSNFNPNRLVTY